MPGTRCPYISYTSKIHEGIRNATLFSKCGDSTMSPEKRAEKGIPPPTCLTLRICLQFPSGSVRKFNTLHTFGISFPLDEADIVEVARSGQNDTIHIYLHFKRYELTKATTKMLPKLVEKWGILYPKQSITSVNLEEVIHWRFWREC